MPIVLIWHENMPVSNTLLLVLWTTQAIELCTFVCKQCLLLRYISIEKAMLMISFMFQEKAV